MRRRRRYLLLALATALSVALPFALITVFLLRLVIRARQIKVATGTAGMVGELGRAETAISPQGKVYVHGELWDACSAQPIPAGAAIRVKSITGMTLEVELVSRPSSSPVEQEPQPQSSKGA